MFRDLKQNISELYLLGLGPKSERDSLVIEKRPQARLSIKYVQGLWLLIFPICI